MKKLTTLISGALLVAASGMVNAQDTIELTSGQMDQVTAAGFATGAVTSVGGSLAIGDGYAGSWTSTHTAIGAAAGPGFGGAAGGGSNYTLGVAVDLGGSLVIGGSYTGGYVAASN